VRRRETATVRENGRLVTSFGGFHGAEGDAVAVTRGRESCLACNRTHAHTHVQTFTVEQMGAPEICPGPQKYISAVRKLAVSSGKPLPRDSAPNRSLLGKTAVAHTHLPVAGNGGRLEGRQGEGEISRDDRCWFLFPGGAGRSVIVKARENEASRRPATARALGLP
jgi:hypothetical protein